ncbi:MAG: tRNA lysidine(34) synthetase TilS [Chitinophagales bacterium]|nr:tRNA lysidine(34) synthetase TilS [Chitinophagales bacterium]
MEKLLEIWASFLAKEQLVRKGNKVLLAVSGGLDSMAMVHLFQQADFKFAIAHCNFQLRGEAADMDEQFVKETAELLKVPFYSIRFDTEAYAMQHGLSIQMAARELRYGWLESVRKSNRYNSLATAHHKNDNVETLLLNLAKGTGVKGLHGILPKNGKLIRPLLCFSKKQLNEWATTQNISYREDASNSENKYQRNKVRLDVLPLLKEINPEVIETVAASIERFKEMEGIYQVGLQVLIKKLVDNRKGDLYIPIALLEQYAFKSTLLFEIVRNYGFNENQVAAMLLAAEHTETRQFFSATHRVIKDRRFYIISPVRQQQINQVVVDNIKKRSKADGFQLKYHLKSAKKVFVNPNPDYAFIDYGLLEFPLVLRRWKQGDYFYPQGMNRKKKKLSKFLMDLKLSLIEKEKVWVLVSGEKVVWVVGYRLDERFAIATDTKHVLEIRKMPLG